MEHIDPTQPMSQDDFCELFEQVPLTDLEREEVKAKYWAFYSVCISTSGVSAKDAWLTTKNVFIAHEDQIKERMQQD